VTAKGLEKFLLDYLTDYIEQGERTDEIVHATQEQGGVRVRQKQGPDLLITVREAA
jgi:hypothetical protein